MYIYSQVKRSTTKPQIAMQSMLFRASTVRLLVRSVHKSRTFASHRGYTRSIFSTLHASRKALAICGGVTFVAASASLFKHSSVSAKEHTDEQKSTVGLRLSCGRIRRIVSSFLPCRVSQQYGHNYCMPRILLQRKEKMEAAKRILEQLDSGLKEDTERLQKITAEVEKYLKSKHR